MDSPTPPLTWRYENLLALEPEVREKARQLVQSRLPNYTPEHCTKLFGGAMHEFSSRCALDEYNELLGVMAFTVGRMDNVEIVAFVASVDGKGIGRFLMESFVQEMTVQQRKTSILTYIEPTAFDFFSKFGFTKNVPARSLYERITSKYVGAIFMYRDLLQPLPESERRDIKVGDRLLVIVDGTLVPRQALVKDVDATTGRVLIHYYFWNPRHDEWIYPHSPRICWEMPLPKSPPKRFSDNMVTKHQVEKLMSAELKKEKKSEILASSGSWPRAIKRFGPVQVKVEGNWIDAKVVQKADAYLLCEFEYNGSMWHQDFPRESVRLGEDQPTVLESLLKRPIKPRAPKSPKASTPRTPKKKRKASVVRTVIELTPPKSKGTKRRRLMAPMSEETAAETVSSASSNEEQRV